MKIISNEKINFKSLEENTFKEMMKLGRKLIQEELRLIDKLIKEYRDKEVFEIKDMKPTTIKTKLGEILISRRYKMVINGDGADWTGNIVDGLLRYQYKLGFEEEDLESVKETLPSLGSEESQMYCVCRDRMKKNRTSWCPEGAEAILKVIMNKINVTITEVITNKARRKIEEELAERIAEPKKVAKIKYEEIRYVRIKL